jgi:DNA-binding Xre family transcriptional regulator
MKPKRKKEISPIVIAVGARIKTIILDKKMRQRDVAHDAGWDVENLRKYIKGTQEMKISTMMRIVESLEINVEDLFFNLDNTKIL